jgi:chromosomal replication initiation ATPase DnaA
MDIEKERTQLKEKLTIATRKILQEQLSIIDEYFDNKVEAERKIFKDIEDMKHHFCKCFAIEFSDLIAVSRKREIKDLRHYFIYATKRIFNTYYSLETIGWFVGGQHHTTVMYAIENIENLISSKNISITTLNKKWNEYKYKLFN